MMTEKPLPTIKIDGFNNKFTIDVTPHGLGFSKIILNMEAWNTNCKS